MNKQKANQINAVAMIFISFWIYYDSINPGIHQLFPMALGIILLSLNDGIMFNNRAQVKAAFVMTFLSFLFLAKMSYETMIDENMRELKFYMIMLIISVFSMITFLFTRQTKSNR